MANPNVILTPVKRFFNLLKVDKQEVLGIYIYALFHGLITLSLPLGIQAIINLISGGQVSTSWVILVVFVIAGIAFTGVLQILQLSITENIQQKIFARSAFEFAYRIPRLRIESVENAYIPELVNRFFDTLSVQKGLSKILMDFSTASLQVLFGLLLLSFYHPFFIIFSLSLIVIVSLIFRFTAPQGLRTSLIESTYKYEVAHWLEELARTMETFKLAGNSSLPMEKTDRVVEGYLGARKAHFKTLVIQYINLVSLKVLIAAGLLLIGGLLVINQQMNIGQFVAAEIIIILVLSSVEKLILSMETIYDVLTAIEKIGNIVDIPLEKDTGSKIAMDENGIAIKLHNVSYQFSDARDFILKDIGLDIKAGEKICISGSSGSGKSLLLQIIGGLHENYSGAINYNGIPWTNWCKADLRDFIGDSLSKEDIFKGTIEENISLGRKGINLNQVQKMAEIVGLSTYVDSLPEGYNTVLVPEGKNLPGSVRLKLILTRSIIGNPKLVLLEDEFNLLHESDKSRFLNYLSEINATVIAISNNIQTSNFFNRTIVLRSGKVIGNAPVKEMINENWFNEIFEIK